VVSIGRADRGKAVAMNRKWTVATILAKAKKYRNLTRMISDEEASQRILELTEELKQRALALATLDEDHIRIRAREIWEENGRPSGRDQEFWYQAEWEFREAEDLAIHASEDA
jgi:DUF2934 family protein